MKKLFAKLILATVILLPHATTTCNQKNIGQAALNSAKANTEKLLSKEHLKELAKAATGGFLAGSYIGLSVTPAILFPQYIPAIICAQLTVFCGSMGLLLLGQMDPNQISLPSETEPIADGGSCSFSNELYSPHSNLTTVSRFESPHLIQPSLPAPRETKTAINSLSIATPTITSGACVTTKMAFLAALKKRPIGRQLTRIAIKSLRRIP